MEEESKPPEDDQVPEEAQDPRNRFRRLTDQEGDVPAEESSTSARHQPERHLGTTQDYFASEPDEIWEEAPPSIPPPSGATHAPLMGTPPIQASASPIPKDESPQGNASELDDTQPNKLTDESGGPDAATSSQDAPQTPAPPPQLGRTPPNQSLSIDEHGMPLPQRVTETDTGATQVTQAAYQAAPESVPLRRPGSGPPAIQTGALPPPPTGPLAAKPNLAQRSSKWLRGLGCLAQLFVLSLFGVVLVKPEGFTSDTVWDPGGTSVMV